MPTPKRRKLHFYPLETVIWTLLSFRNGFCGALGKGFTQLGHTELTLSCVHSHCCDQIEAFIFKAWQMSLPCQGTKWLPQVLPK